MSDAQKLNKLTLSYDNCLVMNISECIIENITNSAFYKMYLKRYVSNISDTYIYFKDSLTYLDYKKIINLCEKEFLNSQYDFSISPSVNNYIEKKEMYLYSRAKLGVELKNQDEKLRDKFNDFANVVNSKMTRKLRDKQMWDSFFMCLMKKSGNFSVPGSGKTSSVLGVYAYLKSRGLVEKIVMIGPKNAFGSWIDEFEVCFDQKEKLKVFNVHDTSYKSVSERRRALKYDVSNRNLILINYESIGSYREELIELISSKTLLVFDEAHKVKRIDGNHASNALAIAQNSPYTIVMTGTPIPNSYSDTYNLFNILFNDEYREFFNFSINMLKNPTKDDVEFINKKIQPFFCRTTKKELSVPEANEDVILDHMATQNENELLRILQLKYRKNKLALLIRILQMETNPKLLLKSLELSDFKCILDDTVEISEIDFVDYSETVKELINEINPTSKIKECIKIVRQLVELENPVIIWCIFKDSIKSLSKSLERIGIKTKCVFGEVPLQDRQKIITDFKDEKFKVLITNPHTLAESVSLHSICHNAVYFEYSYNLVHLLQSKDRIHRLGLPQNQYTQYYYLQTHYQCVDGEFSLGEQIRIRLEEKEKVMLEAIDNNILESMPTNEEDLECIFKNLF